MSLPNGVIQEESGLGKDSLHDGEEESDVATLDDALDEPPVHPIACMQGAFEESMMESTKEPDTDLFSRDPALADAAGRRKMLLEGDNYQELRATLWKQKAGARFHPLWKLTAQISFGLHLLNQQMAKSNEEVVNILQTHVDEVDNFLERTTEDFDLATDDIADRIRYLRLPFEHLEVFDTMLDDTTFRMSIIHGNEKIEHIIELTEISVLDSLTDIGKGMEAAAELAKYLDKLGLDWTDGDEDLMTIYKQMKGNAEGWIRYCRDLHMKGERLCKLFLQLSRLVGEMSKRANIANKRAMLAQRQPTFVRSASSSRIASPPPTSKFSPPVTPNKPLPRPPSSISQSSIPEDPTSVLDQHRDDYDVRNDYTAHTDKDVQNETSVASRRLNARNSELRDEYDSEEQEVNSDHSSVRNITPLGLYSAEGPIQSSTDWMRRVSSNRVSSTRNTNPERDKDSPPSPFADSAYASGTDNIKAQAATNAKTSAGSLSLYPPSQGPLTPSAASVKSKVKPKAPDEDFPKLSPAELRKASGPRKVSATLKTIFHKRTHSTPA